MFSSSASAPACAICFAYWIQPPLETPFRLAMTGNLQRLLGLADVLQVAIGSKVVVVEVGIVALCLGGNVRRLPQVAVEFVAVDDDLFFKQRLQHHGAEAPASSSLRRLPSSLHSGEEEATSGFFSFSPRYLVERSIIRRSLAQRLFVGFRLAFAAGPGIAARYW